MKKHPGMRWLAMASLIALLPLSYRSSADVHRFHRMQQGETLAGLAEVHFGGKEFVSELIAFNGIRNPDKAGPGTLLVLPGPVRTEAMTQLTRAEEALAVAREAAAAQYAPVEYEAAKKSLATSRRFRQQAAYAKAAGLAARTLAMAEAAKRIADQQAIVAVHGRITDSFGTGQISTDQGQTWVHVASYQQLPIPSLLRTDVGSRIEVTLEDGSVFQMRENSQVGLEQYLKDLRTARVKAKLQLLKGVVVGTVQPRRKGDSRFHLEVGETSIAVRGTRWRAKINAKGKVRTELLGGSMDVHVDERVLAVTPGHGLVKRPTWWPARLSALLPPPEVSPSLAGEALTSSQQPLLTWNKLTIPWRRVAYHVEVATDENFNHIVESRVVRRPELRIPALPEGDYRWRVSSINRKGLEGDFTNPQVLRVRKNLDVMVEYKGTLFTADDKLYVGARNSYRILPRSEDTSVVGLEYSIDNGPFRVLDGPLKLEGGGDRVLRVRGKGLEGDRGREEYLECFVDGAPPDMRMALSQPSKGDGNGAWVLARIEATDDSAVEKMFYSLDGRSFQPYEKPLRLSTLQDYTVTVWSEDVLGNRSANVPFEVRGEHVPRGRALRQLPFRL